MRGKLDWRFIRSGRELGDFSGGWPRHHSNGIPRTIIKIRVFVFHTFSSDSRIVAIHSAIHFCSPLRHVSLPSPQNSMVQLHDGNVANSNDLVFPMTVTPCSFYKVCLQKRPKNMMSAWLGHLNFILDFTNIQWTTS